MFEILANKMSHNDDYLPHVCHQCFERYDTEKELEKHKLRYHKTPIVPPDQGATTMTATVVPKELESEWLQFLKRRKEEAAEDKKEAPPAKKAVIKKAEETPKHSEAQRCHRDTMFFPIRDGFTRPRQNWWGLNIPADGGGSNGKTTEDQAEIYHGTR